MPAIIALYLTLILLLQPSDPKRNISHFFLPLSLGSSYTLHKTISQICMLRELKKFRKGRSFSPKTIASLRTQEIQPMTKVDQSYLCSRENCHCPLIPWGTSQTGQRLEGNMILKGKLKCIGLISSKCYQQTHA